MKRYKLDERKDVDLYQGDDGVTYMLWLPFGFRFYNDLVHCMGYDTMKELREGAKHDVIPCDCAECLTELAKEVC
jgi:hypothetical protein